MHLARGEEQGSQSRPDAANPTRHMHDINDEEAFVEQRLRLQASCSSPILVVSGGVIIAAVVDANVSGCSETGCHHVPGLRGRLVYVGDPAAGHIRS